MRLPFPWLGVMALNRGGRQCLKSPAGAAPPLYCRIHSLKHMGRRLMPQLGFRGVKAAA